ncbi:MAG: polynucleotide adenylyltransferase PcnB, partial [Chromatiales bacterium]
LYYNIEDFSVVDYVGGMDDIKAGQIRVVGNTQQRFREDPVRMLRAVRFAVKLGFNIHPQTAAPIFELAPLLSEIPPARLFEEILKLFLGGCAVQTFEQLRHYGVFGQLFPQVEACLSEEEGGFPHMFLARALQNTDRRIAEGKPVTPAFLIAALLWDPMRRLADEHRARELSPAEADQLASDTVISQQVSRIAMPRRYTQMTREIWALQPRLTRRVGGTPFRLLSHPRFRAAYDFLVLRAEAGEEVTELAEWWSEFQGAKDVRRSELISAASKTASAKRRRRQR